LVPRTLEGDWTDRLKGYHRANREIIKSIILIFLFLNNLL